MKHITSQLKTTAKVFIVALVLLLGAHIARAAVSPQFNPPTGAPSAGTNVYPPIHEGAQAQTKNGDLTIGIGNFLGGKTIKGDFVKGVWAMLAPMIISSDANGFVSSPKYCLPTPAQTTAADYAQNCITTWPTSGTAGLWSESGNDLFPTNQMKDVKIGSGTSGGSLRANRGFFGPGAINMTTNDINNSSAIGFFAYNGARNAGIAVEGDGHIQIKAGIAGLGKVLTSDAAGYATWGPGLPIGTINQTMRHDGTNWLANSLLKNNGTNLVNISDPSSPMPQINPPVPTLLVSGNVVAFDVPPTNQQQPIIGYRYVKEMTNTSPVVQITGPNDTPELINYWQNLDQGTFFLGVTGPVNTALQAARISGPCTDSTYGETIPAGQNYTLTQTLNCNDISYTITNSQDTRPYVYELYSQRTVHAGSNGYVEYIFKANRYKREAILGPSPTSTGGTLFAVHGQFSDLNSSAPLLQSSNGVCSDSNGKLIRCSIEIPQPEPLDIKYVRHSWSDINSDSSRYVFCPSSYKAIAASCDTEKGTQVCQVYPAVDGEFGVGNWPVTASNASFATGTAWSSSGVYTGRSGGEVQCDQDNCDVHIQITCVMP